MKASTILYRVRRSNQTIYFGIYDPATRRMRTERTEQAAGSVADEMGLRLDGEREVTHEQWLRLTGILPTEELPAEQVSRDSVASLGQPPARPAAPQQAAQIRNFTNSIPDDTLLIQQPVQRFSCFATESLPVDDETPGVLPQI